MVLLKGLTEVLHISSEFMNLHVHHFRNMSVMKCKFHLKGYE
jgi:hypothetical protein